MQIYGCYSEATETLNTMRRYRKQLASLADRLSAGADESDLAAGAKALNEQVLQIEKGIFIPDLREGWPGRVNQGTDPLRRLSGLPSVVGLGEFPPTVQSYEVFEKLSGQIRSQIKMFEDLQRGEIAAFNEALAQRGIDYIG